MTSGLLVLTSYEALCADTHGPKKPSGHVTAKHLQEVRDNGFVHPKNPFFVADMKEKNVSPSYPARFLYVPMSFANKHLKKFTDPGTLLVPEKMHGQLRSVTLKAIKLGLSVMDGLHLRRETNCKWATLVFSSS